MFESRGLSIVYDDSGTTARPPVVLLHGWATRRTSMRPIFNAMRTSHRILNVDLAGHGDSAVPEDEARLEVAALAEDVAALCDTVDVRSAVLIGHSLGGAVAVELAAQRPDLVSALVALEGILFMPPAMIEQSTALLGALRSPAWRGVMAEVLGAAFLPSDDPSLLQRLLDEMRAMPQHVVAGVAERLLRWDVESAAKTVGAVETPLLYVEATGGLADLDALRDRCPQLQIGRVVAVGHDQMLETPAQSVAMIEAFLTATSTPPPE
jgi:pimeloyl-ACP methyl ester carboxylesterase